MPRMNMKDRMNRTAANLFFMNRAILTMQYWIPPKPTTCMMMKIRLLL